MNKEDTFTARLYKKDKPTLRRYLKKSGIKSIAEFFHQLTIFVQNNKRYEFYNKLTSRDNYHRPLRGCKIDKSKICIQKIVS